MKPTRAMKSTRHGIVILEMIVACGLLAVLVTLSVQLLGAASTQRRTIDQRTLALAEAANLAEQISGLSWNELTPERLAQYSLSAAAQQSLPQGTLKVSAVADDSGPPAQRITIEIHWHSANGAAASPVRLSVWAYRPVSGGAS